jgi:hypothetical protein
MKLTLPAGIASSQDLASLTAEVHEYAKWASHELIKQKAGTKQTLPQPELAPAASDLLRDISAGKPMTQAKIDELLAALEAYRKSAPTMNVTLAAAPSGELKRTLVEWLRKNIANDLLVSFHINRQILGGMVISYKSHTFDWSFRRKLLHGETGFHEVLRRV